MKQTKTARMGLLIKNLQKEINSRSLKMKNKRILILGITLFLFTMVGSNVFAQNVVLRSTHLFADDEITLRLNSNGSMVLSVNNAVSSGTYTISGDVIKLISDSGNLLASCPFQWEQKGVSIRWIEVAGTRLRRR